MYFWSSSEIVARLDCSLPRKPPRLAPEPDMLTVSKHGLGMGSAFCYNNESLRGHLLYVDVSFSEQVSSV